MDARVARHYFVPERAFRNFRKLVRAARTFALATGALLGSSACSYDGLVYAAALPSTSTPATVTWIAERAGYLDVSVSTAGKDLRFFLPLADEGCVAFREPATPESDRYVNAGLLGRLDRGEHRCEPVGVLSLKEWRDRQPRGSAEPIPRSRAQWSVVHRDADVLLLRGRFGLAGELGWVGGADTVAVLERSELCDAIAETGHGSLEFRPVGSDVLTLLGETGRCRLLGIARPLP